MRVLILIGLLLVSLVVLKIYVFDQESTASVGQTSAATKSSAAVLPVDIYIAEEVESSNTIYASGTVVPNEEVDLKSEVSGRLVALDIDEGSYVRKGDMIAKLDDSDLLAQLKKLQFEEDLAAQTEARQRKLLDIDAISKEEYDLAVNAVNTLSADRELLEVQLRKTRVVAPFSGRIGFKNISEGAYITPSETIANLVQTNPVKIDFSVPEKYANNIKPGQEVMFTVDGTDDTFSARIIAVDPVIDQDLRTLRLRAITDNQLGMLLPGMFVQVSVPLANQFTIMVPTESVIPILKGKKVFVKRNGKAMDAEIKTGVRTERTVQVLEGLEVGDSVIVSALMSVKSGMEVQVNQMVDPVSGT